MYSIRCKQTYWIIGKHIGQLTETYWTKREIKMLWEPTGLKGENKILWKLLFVALPVEYVWPTFMCYIIFSFVSIVFTCPTSIHSNIPPLCYYRYSLPLPITTARQHRALQLFTLICSSPAISTFSLEYNTKRGRDEEKETVPMVTGIMWLLWFSSVNHFSSMDNCNE